MKKFKKILFLITLLLGLIILLKSNKKKIKKIQLINGIAQTLNGLITAMLAIGFDQHVNKLKEFQNLTQNVSSAAQSYDQFQISLMEIKQLVVTMIKK